jgi:CubicO group peptidase (beta-lactamase class C family)
MAELATGKPWRQLFDEQLRVPLGWAALSTYGGAQNPNPAGSLACTGLEYTRFLMLQLRQGLDGSTRLLPQAAIQQQRQDAFGASTVIAYSPYVAVLGRPYHYGFGTWLETANGQAPSATNPVNRWSSTGKFGWAPWVAADGAYAALIMTQQADLPTSFVPSETLKAQLDPLIRTALAQGPGVVRTVP